MRTLVTSLGASLVIAVALVAPAAGSPASTNKDIAQTAASSPQFTTLVSLLKKAGLVGALEKGTFTVFAPTNAAFAKLPKSTLTAVGKNPTLLKKVLTYHVVKGKAPAAKVVTLDGKSVKTLGGQGVKIAVRGGKVYLNGSTQVTKTDVMASNGIIHVIDTVILPPES